MNDTPCYCHIFLGRTKLWARRYLAHVPRIGDTVRLSKTRFAKVTDVVWCLDEKTPEGAERCNIALEEEKT